MAFNYRVKTNQQAVTTTTLTGAAPQVGAGNSVLMQNVTPGTLSAKIVMVVKTSSMTMTPSWQVSDDGGSTWINVKTASNASQVATAAGTGSNVTTTIQMDGSMALSGHRLVRAIVTTAAGTADGANDSYAISYNWLQAEAN